MPLTIGAFKAQFFDRVLSDKIDDGAKRALSKFGAFVRTRARSSIRRRKRVSNPGESPTNQVGTLKRFIFFAYSEDRQSVVIGPALTNQRNAQGYGGKTIPQILEYGGMERIFEHKLEVRASLGKYSGQWVRTDLRYRVREGAIRSAVGRPTRIRWAKYESRPYMEPAFQKELPKASAMFKSMIH